MTDLELAKIGFTVRNWLTGFPWKYNRPVLQRESVAGAIGAETKAPATDADVDAVIAALVAHKYIEPALSSGYQATSTSSFTKMGPDTDPWAGWT